MERRNDIPNLLAMYIRIRGKYMAAKLHNQKKLTMVCGHR